jgi:hypothetical protein
MPNADLPLLWRKSSLSAQSGDCVELAELPTAILVRDSKNPEGGRLSLPRREFASIAQRVKSL